MKKAVQSGIMDKRLIVNIDDIRERRVEYFDG